jgi:hypothetical protein
LISWDGHGPGADSSQPTEVVGATGSGNALLTANPEYQEAEQTLRDKRTAVLEEALPGSAAAPDRVTSTSRHAARTTIARSEDPLQTQ